MEELRLAARAYYNNSSSDLQNLAINFFRSMDANRDGWVSFQEFTRFLRHNGYNWVNPNMFSQLDTNNDGGLGFWEVLTFYYIIKTRAVWCRACGAQLHGLHFTCVACFDGGQNTFDLCARCYGGRQFRHHHRVFLDNYILLRSKRGISPGTNVNLNQWFRALELAVGVGNLLNVGSTLVGCSIM
ncbi:hypothetical protein L484_011271 [Morus notabilis]|uniref:EF-hand domain-containing protein n=1 Tax=Morus notabilis TaxID=981085 RepID=W9RR09_9ROSA|nr:hypothetical protein L484_011271 [Morus notabilis]